MRAERRRSEAIAIDLELFHVRKGRGVVHLSVLAEPGRPVETLCERRFEAGEYLITDIEASCAACLRRSEDPVRLSNAMFGQDLGSRLLQLSIERTQKRPEDVRADEKAAKAEPPRLRVITTDRPAPALPPPSEDGDRVSGEPVAPPMRAVVRPGGRPRPAGLDLEGWEEVGPNRYRSPGGVELRVVKREGGGWDVAAVEFSGAATLEQLEDGRVRVHIGDLRFEYSGEFERRLRQDR